MSFFRHREIFRSDVIRSVRERQQRRPRPHRLDEFPVGYSSAGCSLTEPASASPTGHHSALKSSCRSSTFHRTVSSVLTGCLTPGGHPCLLVHGQDEQSGKGYLMLESITAKVSYIPYTREMEEARSLGGLKVNSFLRLRQMLDHGVPGMLIEELGTADSVLLNRALLRNSLCQSRLSGIVPPEEGWGGWLGKYQRAIRAEFEIRDTYAWVLANIRLLKKPVPYAHPSGAVIWVKLEGDTEQDIRRLSPNILCFGAGWLARLGSETDQLTAEGEERGPAFHSRKGRTSGYVRSHGEEYA